MSQKRSEKDGTGNFASEISSEKGIITKLIADVITDVSSKKIRNLKKNFGKDFGKDLWKVLEKLIEVPPKPELGDYAFPCFSLAKSLRKNPQQLASWLREEIEKQIRRRKEFAFVSRIENRGPYLNFFLNKGLIAGNILKCILKKGSDYGRGEKKDERIMIEFSQPNTHKAFHIGHLRNAALGDSLVRMMRFSGYRVISANYFGDIGAHVAKCLWCLKKFHMQDIQKVPLEKRGEWLGDIYTEAVQRIGNNDELKKEVALLEKKLEEGDKELTTLWKKTREWSLQEFGRIYNELGIEFDVYFFESEMEKKGKNLVLELLKNRIARESEGAVVMDLRRYGLDIFLLLRSDRTALYSTKDIALAKEKFERYKIDRSIYVVGSEQKLYFKQLFKTLELMGFENAKKCYHLAYELVMLQEGKMSSREGNVVLYSTLASELFKRASEEVEKRHADWSQREKEETARKIAVGAMKFGMLNQDNNKVITFDIGRALDFEGETAAYVQYAYTRASSILRKEGELFERELSEEKAGKVGGEKVGDEADRERATGRIKEKRFTKRVAISKIDFSKLEEKEEICLIRKLTEFPELVLKASEEYKPFLLPKYLLELSKLFTAFYHECPIIRAETSVKNARLALVESVRIVLKNALNLMGIDVLERM